MPRPRRPIPVLDAAHFATRMAALGPFEPAPRLAVAVSGGPDSMALALLLRDWVRLHGGAVTALVVDHRLRPESSAEATTVVARLAVAGVPAVILPWERTADAPRSQVAARAARHALLAGWCRTAGVLHLLLAHHADDQAETVLLRLAGGSGPDGLAGIAAIAETAELRLLRPLLDLPKAALVDWLAATGVAAVEDPTNRNPDYARPRLRQARAVLAREGLETARLGTTAARLGATRALLDDACAAWFARSARPRAGGVPGDRSLGLDAAAFGDAPRELRHRLLARAIAAVGGHRHLRDVAVDRLLDRLEAAPAGRATLGGCLVSWTAAGLELRPEPGTAAHGPVLCPAPFATLRSA